MQTKFFFLLFTFFASSLFAQNYPTSNQGYSGSVSGTIVDSHKKPIQFATIYVKRVSDSLVVTGGVTEESGKFSITEIPWGTFFIEVSYMGYAQHQTAEFTLDAGTPHHKLGQFMLRQQSTTLKGIEISVQKNMIETNLDKTVYNVENSVTSEGATAVEVLEEVPAVDVDIEGNVQLRGSSNITLLIDGRPTELTLDQIPANDIASIEVVTNPSARFDPDGMGGIINVVLKKKRVSGFNALFSLNGGFNIFQKKGYFSNGNANMNLNYTYNKINIYFTYNYRRGNRRSAGTLERDSWFHNDTTHLSQDNNQSLPIYWRNRLNDTTHLSQANNQWSNSNGHNTRLSLDYFINTKNTLTLSIGFNHHSSQDSSFTNSLSSNVFGETLIPYSSYNQLGKGSWKSNNIYSSLFYKKTFARKGQELTADLMYTERNNNSFDNSLQNFTLYDGTPNYFQKSETLGKNRVANGQVDFVTPVGNGGRIETGYKFTYRTMEQDYSLFYGESDTTAIEDIQQSNDFTYKEVLNAAYFIYSNTFWKKFKMQLGLRGELANTNSHLESSDTTYKKTYFNIFPTVHLVYDFNEQHALQLSYSRRVTRPRFWDLNPFVNASNKLNLRMGNPNLTPEFANNIELAYVTNFKKTSFNVVAFYRQRNDLIGRYTELHEALIEDGYIFYELYDGEIYQTPVTSEFDSLESFTYTLTSNQNINKSQSYGFELIYNQKLWKFWRITFSGNFYRTKIDTTFLIDPNLAADWSWGFRLNQTFTLPHDWSIQLNFRFRSRSLTTGSMGWGTGGVGQGKRNANYSLNFGLKKSFFNKQLSISLNIRNLIYNPVTKIHSYSHEATQGYDSYSERFRSAYQTNLTITYKLNNYKRRMDEFNGGEEEYMMEE